jgi:hypothetical protein
LNRVSISAYLLSIGDHRFWHYHPQRIAMIRPILERCEANPRKLRAEDGIPGQKGKRR